MLTAPACQLVFNVIILWGIFSFTTMEIPPKCTIFSFLEFMIEVKFPYINIVSESFLKTMQKDYV